MKQLILSIVFVLTASTALAQQQPKVFITQQPCDAFDEMFTTLGNYEEQLLFTGEVMQFAAPSGQPYTSGMFFFVNQDTGTWSLLSLYGDGTACMIANGSNFKPYAGPAMPVKPKPEVEQREQKEPAE
jgi:hypothetical protein